MPVNIRYQGSDIKRIDMIQKEFVNNKDGLKYKIIINSTGLPLFSFNLIPC